MCHLYPYNNVKLLRKFFYINICGFIGRDKFLYFRGSKIYAMAPCAPCTPPSGKMYQRRVLDNSYLQFKFQLTTSDSIQITAGGPKVPIEGFVPLDAP